LNKFFIIITIALVIFGAFTIIQLSDQDAIAKSKKKFDFTQTFTSSQDPGKDHQNHQLALILSPNEGTLYDGSLTYTADKPVEIVVLHEINKNDVLGQPTWTVDEKKVYGLSLIDQKTSAGSLEFTGAALALHTSNGEKFSATVSVDGWIRGQPTELKIQTIEIESEEPTLHLSRANVATSIPMHLGFFNGESVYYIITDSNDSKQAESITEKQNWKVELAPPLSDAPDSALDQVYIFTNGVNGDGINGFQNEIFTSTPDEVTEYSALRLVTNVSWKPGQKAEVLDSVELIEEAKEAQRIQLEKTKVVLNMPQIIWPQGQMPVSNDNSVDNMSYGKEQILKIDKEAMKVTFVAHRGWGPDGRTIYYIVTDATPSGPAQLMGVSDSPKLASMIAHSSAVDLFQFKDGIKGSGPLGFQPGIAAAGLGDSNYSPMWRIHIVSWNDPQEASILQSISDIDAFKSEGLIDVSLARPMNSDHIVNSPFIDPFQ